MKRKYYILGVLTLLCLLGTGYYAWTLYDAYRKQVAEWNEGAKAAFEEALWVEVNKRADIPIYTVYNDEGRWATLNERIPDTVSVMTEEGVRNYKIDRDRYENSLIKETGGRGNLSVLFEMHPLSIDTLAIRWDSLSGAKHFSIRTQIRHIYTDLNLNNDTVFSVPEKQFSRLDSLTVKYLGYLCEHEVTAYVSYPYWMASIADGDCGILLFPWILLVLLFVCYPKLEALAIHKEVIEKTIEIEKTVIVEKEIHVSDVTMHETGILRLPDGTLFDSFAGSLNKGGLQKRLQPQSVSLLKFLLSKDNHEATSDEICMKLWGDTGHSDRLYSAVRRLRNDLKAVKSELLVDCSCGMYELKSPISSNISDQN